MSTEGVMVSYNHSEGEHANIVTVAASGIKFGDRWVLTHGSILSPLKQAKDINRAKGKPILSEQFYENLPEIYVTCERPKSDELQKYYDGLEALSRQRSLEGPTDPEHSSYQVRVLTGRICHVWQCPLLDRCVDDILYSWTIGHRDGDIEKQTQLGKALLSVFVLVDLGGDDRGLKPLRPLSALLDLAKPPPTRGVAVEIHSTPFGCEAFLNAVTRGAVCGVVGKRPSLLLTDAATALGSEGGPVFSDNELIGMVVCSVSWWRGEWVGLTLVAPLMVVLANKLRVAPPSQLAPLTSENLFLQHILSRIDSTTVLVRCGASWGTGIYIGGGFVLTCAHVVKNHESHSVSLYCQGSRATAKVRYKTRDDRAFDLALIYSNLESWGHLTKAQFATAPAIVGESVLAAGYPYFNENNLEELRPTITAGHVNTVSPSMLQTSCCVQSGFSGGAIYRLRQSQPNMTLEVVGIIVSNARTNKEACYPYINMAVPAQAFDKQIQEYLENKDATKLKMIENKKDMVQSQWRLMPYRSKI